MYTNNQTKRMISKLAKLNAERLAAGRGQLALYQPRLGRIKVAAKCYIDVSRTDTVDARSYDWWSFLTVVKGHIFWNTHNYSVTTAGHKSGAAPVLSALGVKIDGELCVPGGFQREFSLDCSCRALGTLIVAGRTARKPSRYTKQRIKRLEHSIRLYAKLTGVKVKRVNAMLADGIDYAETERRERLDRVKREIAAVTPGLTLVVSNSSGDAQSA